MFKQLTNVRKEKDEKPELVTTPTQGTIKINSSGLSKVNGNLGDYFTVIEDDDTNSPYFGKYLVKGYGPSEGKNARGAKLSSSTNKNSGAMDFSSGMAWSTLGGNKNTKLHYSIEEGITSPDPEYGTLYKLSLIKEEAKSPRKEKETA